MRNIFLSLIIFALGTFPAVSSEQNVKDRQNAMQQVREAVKVLFPMAKGKSEYDDFLVISMLEQMLKAAEPYTTYFPSQPEVGVHSEAAEAIWTDRTGFEKALAKFLSDIEKTLNAEPQSLDQFQPLFAEVAGNCKSCHKVYRMK